MFEKIRKPSNRKSIFSYIIFGIICLVFVFIGIPARQMSSLSGSAVQVNHEIISWQEYRNYLQMLQNQSETQKSPDSDTKRHRQIQQSAINLLVNRALITQLAKTDGLYGANQAVRDRIVTLPWLQENGRFVRSRYYAFLENQRLSANTFEDRVKQDIQVVQFQNLFRWVAQISLSEKQKNQQLGLFKVQVSYLSFSTKAISQSEWKSIDAQVKNSQQSKLDLIIKNKNWQWEQTEEFDLSRFYLPDLPSHKRLFDEVIHHLPQTGLIKKIITVRDQSFILKVDRFYKKLFQPTEMHSSLSLFTNQIASHMLFQSYLEFERNRAQIKLHPRLQNPL